MSNNKVITIGAGAAGLAAAVCLKQAGIPNFILEKGNQVGATWRRHYDRLHLHTDKKNSELPFAPYPKEYPRYPSRDQVVKYLEDYAQRFELDIRFDQEVKSARREAGQWLVETQDTLHASPNLVVATGYARQPVRPTWPGLESFRGRVMHSSEYTNGSAFKGKRVLVVGFGNSGGEIAIDLYEHGAEPAIAVRNAVNVIPRELVGIPVLSIGILQNKLPAWLADAINAPILRAAVGELAKYGLRKLPYGPATQIRQDRRIPLIDVGTLKLIREGHITVLPGVAKVSENRVSFEGGKEVEFQVLILATGYRPRLDDFLQGASSVLDEEGTPRSTGKESSIAGLYFCGYYVSPTGMLREIAIEARQISAAIASRSNML
ncbi:MAG TPA: NAD(P)/FAD-dependent oxidoreductase [Anaerolineales bacterium]|nr:NAD(P)/FAD-dependent oxidoreductase [Anaerolineales bacterium]